MTGWLDKQLRALVKGMREGMRPMTPPHQIAAKRMAGLPDLRAAGKRQALGYRWTEHWGRVSNRRRWAYGIGAFLLTCWTVAPWLALCVAGIVWGVRDIKENGWRGPGAVGWGVLYIVGAVAAVAIGTVAGLGGMGGRRRRR